MKISQARNPPVGAASSIQRSPSTRSAEILECVEVGIETAAADEIPAGWGHPRFAEARQQISRRAGRCPDPAREILVDLDLAHTRGAEPEAVVGDPGHLDPEPLQERDLCLGVADARHPVQNQLLLGEQAGGEDRQRRVLVASDGQLSRERHAALNHEFLHGLGKGNGRQGGRRGKPANLRSELASRSSQGVVSAALGGR